MPRRWERELEKLEDLHAPAGTRSRIESGPRGDGMPPSPRRGQRLLAGTVAFAVFAVALAFTARAFGSRGTIAVGTDAPDVVLLSFTVTGTGTGVPTGTLTVDDKTIEGNGSTYTWNFDGGSMVADTFGTEFQFETWTDVAAGAPINVEGTATGLEGWLDASNNDSREPRRISDLDLENASVPSEPGRYVLEFRATWPEGARTFYFPVHVVPSTEVSPSASLSPVGASLIATLTSSADGSTPRFTLSDGKLTRDYPVGGRWLDEPVYTVGMLFSFDRAIEPGGSLSIETDADRVAIEIASSWPDGRWRDASPIEISSGVAQLPSEPATYQLHIEGWWADGHVGSSVVITIGHPSEPSPSPLPSVQEGVVPDVVGLGVADAEKLLSQAGYEATVVYTPYPGVAAGMVASMAPGPGPLGSPGVRITLHVSGTDVALDGYLSQLDCDESDMMPFEDKGGHDDPGGTLYITINVGGFERSDQLSQIRSDDPASPDDGLWQVSRDGAAIAVIAAPSLEGIACRGSGIGGA
jgi:PASTA domain-containing protein